jgi:Flp pilus assembly pilin Flp
MLSLYCKLRALLATRDQGVTVVEYALILAAIIGVVATVVIAFGQSILGLFNQTCTNMAVKC